jgi:hypothetical protein
MNACRSVCGVTCLGDPGAAGGLADDPPGAVPVPGGPRRQRDSDHLPP